MQIDRVKQASGCQTWFRTTRARLGWLLASVAAWGGGVSPAIGADREGQTIPAGHPHARMLLENALKYVDTTHKLVDPVSGYPVEGWNQDPSRGLFLRSFTQLTAIGQYMELLGNVAAGRADSAGLSREEAAKRLAHLVATLRQDQADPKLAAKGLLGNFLDLATGKRLGPLASDVDKSMILKEFGDAKGNRLWQALTAAGWIAPRNKDQEAEIKRGERYGFQYFEGPLLPFADSATKTKVMDIIDRRVVMIIFGDNSNLTASAAKTIGALLEPGIKDRADMVAVRQELDAFLDAQRSGYERLYDVKLGLFYFGWDATRDRLFGWEDASGNWTTGHMDYLINEFRGPATFVAVRYGLPKAAVANLGFYLKPARLADGVESYALAPWEGSAFQALGLSLMLGEAHRSGWKSLLGNLVQIEEDYARQHHLPGFLSESYTGDGVQYTGSVGIPAITVAPKPRITDAASLYTLGTAYSVAPDRVEKFLADQWPKITPILTDHGPWEGFNITQNQVIPFQTTAHTLALTLGLIGHASADMARYLGSRGLTDDLDAYFQPATQPVNLLEPDTQTFAWTAKGRTVTPHRDGPTFQVKGDDLKEFGLAFVPPSDQPVNLSGLVMTLTYRAGGPAIGPALIALKSKPGAPDPNLIPQVIHVNLADTGSQDVTLRIPLPATPGLQAIREVVLTHGPDDQGRAVELTVAGFRFDPPKSDH